MPDALELKSARAAGARAVDGASASIDTTLRIRSLLGLFVRLHTVLLLLLTGLLIASGAPVMASNPSPAVQSLVDALNARHAEDLLALINLEALSERVVAGLEVDGDLRTGLLKGMRGAGMRLALNSVAHLEHNNTHARFLRSRTQGGVTFALVRYDHHDAEGESAGVDYIEFELGRDGRLIDWYSHAQADATSDIVRRLISAMMPNEGLFGRLLGISRMDSKLHQLVRRIGEQQRSGDFAGAYASLGEVEGPWRETKVWAVLRVANATHIGDPSHAESLKHLYDHFGNDPSLQLLLLDHHFSVGNYAATIDAIERFERAVIEDAVTTQFKCTSALHGEDWSRARAFCERSLEIDPAVESTWWLLVTVGLRTTDAELVLRTLDGYERQFSAAFDPDLLVQDSQYAWLKVRPEFKKWAAKRRG